MEYDTKVELAADRVPELLPLIQEGVWFRVRVGVPVFDVLTRGLGLDPDYVTGRIQTGFLNFSPVDDFHSVCVPDGAVMAFSAAMPGLAGAVMRSGGVVSGFRSSISAGAGPAGEERDGLVKIKFFNLLAKELGPGLLERGVLIEPARLAELAPDASLPDDGLVLLTVK